MECPCKHLLRRTASGRNPRGIHEERRNASCSPDRASRRPRFFGSRAHDDTRPLYQMRSPTFLITGAARKQPPGCFVLSEALRDGELSFPFFFRRWKAIGVASPKTSRTVATTISPPSPPLLSPVKRAREKIHRSHPPVETTDTRTQPRAYAHAHASDRTCIRECSALSLRFIIGNRPDI